MQIIILKQLFPEPTEKSLIAQMIVGAAFPLILLREYLLFKNVESLHHSYCYNYHHILEGSCHAKDTVLQASCQNHTVTQF